jgi:hypothetical protein
LRQERARAYANGVRSATTHGDVIPMPAATLQCDQCDERRTRQPYALAEQAGKSAHLHAGEAGWGVQGQTCWLWRLANGQVCYYLVDRCCGSPGLQRFFGDAFADILLHDSWTAYESIDLANR